MSGRDLDDDQLFSMIMELDMAPPGELGMGLGLEQGGSGGMSGGRRRGGGGGRRRGRPRRAAAKCRA